MNGKTDNTPASVFDVWASYDWHEGRTHYPEYKIHTCKVGSAFDLTRAEQIIQDVMPIYCGEAEDFTMGAQLFYTPSAMEPGKQSPGWNFDLLEEVIIPGIDPYYEGRFFRYK